MPDTKTAPDLTGQRFGRLTVTGPANPGPAGAIQWFADCDCGHTGIIARGSQMTRGKKKSCGCLVKTAAQARAAADVHPGDERERALRGRWRSMKDRARRDGNAVCGRWMDFRAFAQDVGAGFEPGLTLRLLDEAGVWESGNVHWVTQGEQRRATWARTTDAKAAAETATEVDAPARLDDIDEFPVLPAQPLTMDWRHRAACRDFPTPDDFFPIGNTGPALLLIEDAKAVCRRCDVIGECLQWALESGQDAGVWGGMSEDERRALKRRAARARSRMS